MATLSKSVTVRISADDIKKSTPGNLTNSPLARALVSNQEVATGRRAQAQTAHDWSRVQNDGWDRAYLHPEPLRLWLMSYQRGETVKPITVQLRVMSEEELPKTSTAPKATAPKATSEPTIQPAPAPCDKAGHVQDCEPWICGRCNSRIHTAKAHTVRLLDAHEKACKSGRRRRPVRRISSGRRGKPIQDRLEADEALIRVARYIYRNPYPLAEETIGITAHWGSDATREAAAELAEVELWKRHDHADMITRAQNAGHVMTVEDPKGRAVANSGGQYRCYEYRVKVNAVAQQKAA